MSFGQSVELTDLVLNICFDFFIQIKSNLKLVQFTKNDLVWVNTPYKDTLNVPQIVKLGCS